MQLRACIFQTGVSNFMIALEQVVECAPCLVHLWQVAVVVVEVVVMVVVVVVVVVMVAVVVAVVVVVVAAVVVAGVAAVVVALVVGGREVGVRRML